MTSYGPNFKSQSESTNTQALLPTSASLDVNMKDSLPEGPLITELDKSNDEPAVLTAGNASAPPDDWKGSCQAGDTALNAGGPPNSKTPQPPL